MRIRLTLFREATRRNHRTAPWYYLSNCLSSVSIDVLVVFLLVCLRFEAVRHLRSKSSSNLNTPQPWVCCSCCYWKMSRFSEEFTIRLTSHRYHRGRILIDIPCRTYFVSLYSLSRVSTLNGSTSVGFWLIRSITEGHTCLAGCLAINTSTETASLGTR